MPRYRGPFNRGRGMPLKITRRTPSAIAALAFAAQAGFAAPAMAQSQQQRIDELEARLTQAMEAMGQLASSVEEMRGELEGARQELSRRQSESDELSERVIELEDVTMNHDEAIGSRAITHAFDARYLDIGGFVDLSATTAIGEDGTTSAFDRQVFELLVKAGLGENWEMFVAQAFVRNSPLQFTDPGGRREPFFADNNSPVMTDTVIAWAEYRHSDALRIQAGRFITPHGIINIEHFPATLLDPEQPMFLRPFPGQTMFPNFTNGVNIHGSRFVGRGGRDRLTYNVYGGVWAGNATNGNVGARLAYTLGGTGLTIGANAMAGERGRGDDSFVMGGLDLQYDRGNWLWKNEIFVSDEEAGGDRFAFYTMPAYRFSERWTGFYRFDYLDNGAPGGETIENVVGLNFQPVSNVRLRGIYRLRSFRENAGLDSAEAHIFNLSATFNF